MAEKRSQKMSGRRALNRRAHFLFAFLIIAVSAVIIIVFMTGRQGVPQNAKELPFAANTNYAFAGKRVAYIKENSLYYDDLEQGKENWYYELSTSDLSVAASDTMLVVYQDRFVQVLSPKGDVLSAMIEFKNEILSVECGSNYFAVLSEDAFGAPSLSLINQAGKQLEPIEFPVSNSVLDYKFYGGNDQLWILTANVEAAYPALTIYTYRIGETKVNTSVISIQDELLEHVFVSDNYLYAVGTHLLYKFDNTGKIVEKYDIYGWDFVDGTVKDGKELFLFQFYLDTETPSQTRRMRLLQGNTFTEFRAPANCIGAFVYTDKVVCATNDHVYIFDLTGTLIRDYALNHTYEKVEKSFGSYLVFTQGENLFLAPIR